MLSNIKTLTKSDLFELLSKRFDSQDKKLSEIPNPIHLLNAKKAAKKIVQAIQTNKRITLVGDYDVDGVTSTAIME